MQGIARLCRDREAVDREAVSTHCVHIFPVSRLLGSRGRVPFITAGWSTAYDSGLRPDREVGAALFPAFSGLGGARLRVNLGLDRARPLRFPPQWMADERREQVAAALRAACRSLTQPAHGILCGEQREPEFAHLCLRPGYSIQSLAWLPRCMEGRDIRASNLMIEPRIRFEPRI